MENCLADKLHPFLNVFQSEIREEKERYAAHIHIGFHIGNSDFPKAYGYFPAPLVPMLFENGCPDTGRLSRDETARLMEQVDNALREEFGRDAVAVLTGIYTGEGQRNWVFYVSSLQSFRYRFNHALEPFETLPLEIYAEHDPEWAEYREMRSLTEIADGCDLATVRAKTEARFEVAADLNTQRGDL